MCLLDGGRALERQSGGMTAQSVVARNGGYRGWRHERAVTMAPKKERRARRWWQAVAATAGGWRAAGEGGGRNYSSNGNPHVTTHEDDNAVDGDSA